jgi:hypothetical protein
VHHHFQLAVDAIRSTTGDLPIASLNLRPPGKWSIAEILEHLTLAYRRGALGFTKVAETGEPRAKKPTWQQAIGRMLIVDLAYFPRARAPEPTTPTGGIPVERVRESALEALAALDRAADQAEVRCGLEVPLLNHPYFAGMNLRQWRKFHWRHTVHHMGQVRAILGTP